MIDPILFHPELARRDEDLLPPRAARRESGARAHWRRAGEFCHLDPAAFLRLGR